VTSQEKKRALQDEAQEAGLVDCGALERELGSSLGPVLDALSLGLDDKAAAELAEVSEEEVRYVRSRLGGVGSQMGIGYKKPVCHNKETGGPS
jgi:hypothetical protein